jgi:hypothetical protein
VPAVGSRLVELGPVADAPTGEPARGEDPDTGELWVTRGGGPPVARPEAGTGTARGASEVGAELVPAAGATGVAVWTLCGLMPPVPLAVPATVGGVRGEVIAWLTLGAVVMGCARDVLAELPGVAGFAGVAW